ncbi:MAG: isoprenylcysteine carboxylmethyltransferase family protein [Pseudomonadota bacterium]|nr:isoprenylcysteine carboxylmethyltransferase family protein [Pseudomonadota bacterium]
MNDLHKKAWKGLAVFFVALGLLILLPASTLYYWQGWIYLAVFFISTVAITLYLIKKDPALLARRMNAGSSAEKETTQKVIQFVAQIAFVALYLVSSFDHRFAWSHVPLFVAIGGDILVGLGFFIVFLVFKENTFTSATIEVAQAQRVITTGPYARVRHPMYSGALVLLLGPPLALGSWWGLAAFVPMLLTIIWRLRDEEKFLAQNLSGYSAYLHRVRARLVPLIF